MGKEGQTASGKEASMEMKGETTMKEAFKKMTVTIGAVALMIGSLGSAVAVTPCEAAGQGRLSHRGNVVVFTPPNQAAGVMGAIDIQNAIPMDLPRPNNPPRGILQGGLDLDRSGVPGVDAGAPGSGKTVPRGSLDRNPSAGDASLYSSPDFDLQAFGSSNHPFTTSRVDVNSSIESRTYPHSAVGKLYFLKDGATHTCSASLIKRGLIVTAAHCVVDYGKNKFYTNWKFIPASYDSARPFGEWIASSAAVMTSYYDGTDSCAYAGVACKSDVAVLNINPQGNAYPGTRTGWLGYGWDGFGFTDENIAMVHELGYPASHDKGLRMQRTDSQGFKSVDLRDNTVWGSSQTGGSNGAPLVVNLGIQASLSGTNPAYHASPNIVVGVASWIYADSDVKEKGGSTFTSSNIVPLVTTACSMDAAACK
jgi:V8-like Glu-specific endopeptidase